MWIVLLDHSASMGEPFRGDRRPSEQRGRIRFSEASIKLDAAKESLLEHLEGLPIVERLAILGFTSRTSTIFEGDTSQLAAARQALDDVHAINGTDIGQALSDARAVAAQSLSSQEQSVARVLVISDGLSDRADAERAARELAKLTGTTVIIDVILIDPTDDGEAVARAIAIGGTVQAVMSAVQLDLATEPSSDAPLRRQRRMPPLRGSNVQPG